MNNKWSSLVPIFFVWLLIAQAHYIFIDQLIIYFLIPVAAIVLYSIVAYFMDNDPENSSSKEYEILIHIYDGDSWIDYNTTLRRKNTMVTKDAMTVKDVIANIAETRTQTSANSKDENRVALAMLNDPTYVVDIYNKEGIVGQYSPYAETRDMISNIIKDTAKISEGEAKKLAENYQFDKKNSQAMINFGKEFVLTYLQTGRKLPMGCREKSNCSLIKITKDARTSSFPVPNGVDANGEKIYTTTTGTTPAYESIRVSGACPAHLKNKAKKS